MNHFLNSPSRAQFFSWIILLLPALVLTTPVGVGLIEVAILLGAIVYAKPLWSQRATLFQPAQSIILVFALNLAAVTMSLLWSGFEGRFFENPFKMLLLVPAIGLVALTRPKTQWFWYGLFLGTAGAAWVALYQRFGLNLPRVHGFHMAILFGDIAMAMALMSLAGIQLFAGTRLAVLPYLSFFAGVTASILSGSRGGWLALMLSVIPMYSYGRHTSGRRILVIVLTGAALLIAACFIPQTGVRERFLEISTEISSYQTGDPFTSIGSRFEMWKGALKMFFEHPFFGIGHANFHQGLNALIARGEIHPTMHIYYHAHNEMLHALATGGVVGAAALLLLYVAPLVFFMRCLRRHDASQAYALAGLLLVLSFIDFGLTQVLFSHHVGAAFYAATISILAGICIQLRSPPASVKQALE